ncbi:MAG: acetate/propionate family kinase [Polyangiales bacterium]
MTSHATHPELLVLSVNAGSSSLKLSFWQVGGSQERVVWKGAAEGLGGAESRLWLRPGDAAASGNAGSQAIDRRQPLADVGSALSALLDLCQERGIPAPAAIGHRVVHGGPAHSAPARIDAALLTEIRGLVSWAPLHLPAALDAIDAVTARFPDAAQVACFDTAFHRTLPELAQRLPLPRELWDRGVRRYGFHGLSYEYVVAHLGGDARGRLVIAHLGNGSSLTALRDGQPVDTSMGFTPNAGVMMGTRTGDLDPGVLVYLQASLGHDATSVARLVERQSGLLGVSGSTSDVRQLLERAPHEPHADQALRMFCYGVRKQIGAYAAVLGGLDMLVFTGGIGERAAWVREEVCRELGYLGVAFDAEANAKHARVITEPASRCSVRVVATDEDRMIARHTARLAQR